MRRCVCMPIRFPIAKGVPPFHVKAQVCCKGCPGVRTGMVMR